MPSRRSGVEATKKRSMQPLWASFVRCQSNKSLGCSGRKRKKCLNGGKTGQQRYSVSGVLGAAGAGENVLLNSDTDKPG